MNDREPLTFTVNETARELRVGRNTVYELIRAGELPALHIGRAIRVPVSALRAWLESNTSNTERNTNP